MPITNKQFQKQEFRLADYLTITTILFIFFVLEMPSIRQLGDNDSKGILFTVLHALLIYLPIRMLTVQLRKRFSGMAFVKRRLQIVIGISVLYAGLLGIARAYAEHCMLFSGAAAGWSAYYYSAGITMLFTLLQIAVYEALYFFSEWQLSRLEAEEIKQSAMRVQMDSLKVQIQPHFLFNTLNTLMGLIEVNQQGAVIFTQNMAYVYRYLLQASEKKLVSLGEELKFAATYFMLLKTCYADGLELVAEAHGASDFRLPPLTLQVLIENAVKHNVVTKLRPLHIYIYLDKRNRKLIVQNNCQPKLVKDSTGMGLKHLQKRYALLHLPQLAIQSSAETFSVSVPLQKTSTYEHSNY
jgi:hypothetical protein